VKDDTPFHTADPKLRKLLDEVDEAQRKNGISMKDEYYPEHFASGGLPSLGKRK
jgi:hypothetical protein